MCFIGTPAESGITGRRHTVDAGHLQRARQRPHEDPLSLPVRRPSRIRTQRCINDWNVTNGQDARVGCWTVRNVCGEAADAAGAVNVLVHALLRHSVMTRAAMAEIGTHVLCDL